jgi:hypothetical protein
MLQMLSGCRLTSDIDAHGVAARGALSSRQKHIAHGWPPRGNFQPRLAEGSEHVAHLHTKA